MNKAVLEFVHGLVLNQTQIKSRHDFITFVVFYQTESPVMIQPFLEKMTKSELHAVMVGGFATIAGSVYGAYVKFGVSCNRNFSGLSDKLCLKEVAILAEILITTIIIRLTFLLINVNRILLKIVKRHISNSS